MREGVASLLGGLLFFTFAASATAQPPGFSPSSGPGPNEWPPAASSVPPMPLRLIAGIDTDRDGQLSDEEMANIPQALEKLDLDNNRRLDTKEMGWWPGVPRAPVAWGQSPPWGQHPGSREFQSPVESPPRTLAETFQRFDTDGNSGVSEDELPASMRELFTSLDRDKDGRITDAEVGYVESLVYGESNGWELRRALMADEPTSEAVQGVREILVAAEKTSIENQRQIDRARRSEWLTYLMTVGAMFAGVVSFGHLIGTPPPSLCRWSEVDSSPRATRPVVLSLVLICILSAIDLVWTQARAGSLHFVEMNPLGSEMLLAGASPTIFKVATLAVSVLLLFSLRQFRGAQKASWWMCMVCTLLTFRWLVLDSAIFS